MLAIKNLHAGVEEKEILKGINLEVNPGEIHAIMGPNGAGKSTFASIIAGKEDFEVSKGQILLEGEDLADLAPEERAHKGVFLSFQYPVEIPGVTVTNFIKTAINPSNPSDKLRSKGVEVITMRGRVTVKPSSHVLYCESSEAPMSVLVRPLPAMDGRVEGIALCAVEQQLSRSARLRCFLHSARGVELMDAMFGSFGLEFSLQASRAL